MTAKRAFILAGALIVLGSAVALVLLVLLRPLAVFETAERGRLRWEGLERHEIAGPRGRLVSWRGGEGPLVIFLHGANDQAGTWVRIVRPLAARHRVVLADLAGHGESAPTDGPLTVKDLVDGVEALVEGEAGGGRVTLVGNSLGGWLALLYADRHPGRTGHVVLVNGAAVRGDGTESEVSLLPETRDEARRAFDAVMSPSSPRPAAFVLDDLVRRAAASPLGRLMAQPVPDQYVLDRRLGELRVPVTLVWGADDRMLPVSYAKRVAAALPASRLELVERCGHVPQRECPDRLLPALERALVAPPRLSP